MSNVALDAPLDDPEQGLVSARVGGEGPLGPAMGALRRIGDESPRRRRCDRLIEGHGDVRAERLLDAERDDLEAAGVGQDRPVPGHERVEATEPGDPLVAGTEVEVVRVRQDDRRASSRDVVRVERLDGRVRADRHELRRLDDAMRQRETTEAGAGRPVCRRRNEDVVTGGRALEGGWRHEFGGRCYRFRLFDRSVRHRSRPNKPNTLNRIVRTTLITIIDPNGMKIWTFPRSMWMSPGSLPNPGIFGAKTISKPAPARTMPAMIRSRPSGSTLDI